MDIEMDGDVEAQIGPLRVRFTQRKPSVDTKEVQACLDRLSALLLEPGIPSPQAVSAQDILQRLRQLLGGLLA